MSWFTRLFNSARGDRLSRDLDREMHFHLAEKEDSLVAQGMTRERAELEARRRFGNYTHQKERTRDTHVFAWLDALVNDLRYATRSLRASPGFTLVAILSLALGIGANTAIFALVNAVLLRSLPVERPQDLLLVKYGTSDFSTIMTNPLWEQIRDRKDVFASAAAYGNSGYDMADGGERRNVNGHWVSGSFFSTLGLGAVVGRPLRVEDDVRGCPGAVAISGALWQREFAGDPNIAGKTIRLDGHAFPIVGVIDPRFTGMMVGTMVDVYVPLCAMAIIDGKDNALDRRTTWFLHVIGRQSPQLTLAQTRARLRALSPAIFEATRPTGASAANTRNYVNRKLDVSSAATGTSFLRMMYKPALIALMVIVTVVLLVACANVANLLLARATVRQREMAVRVAIGAGRGRIVRQLLTESLLLSGTGALLGLFVARWGSHLLVHYISTGNFPVEIDLSLDWRVLAFTITVAMGTGILFGMAPAWRASRVDPQTAMKERGRGVMDGHSRHGAAKVLVVLQVALSLVLVTVAGLLVGSFRALATLDPGFRPDHVVIVSADLRAAHIPLDQQLDAQQQILDRIRSTPGVRAATSSVITPVGGMMWNDEAAVDGFTPTSRGQSEIYVNEVSSDYFTTLSQPMLAGRDFDARETLNSPKVAIVNETMAKRFFHGANPIGRSYRTRMGDSLSDPVQIIGLVKDSKYQSLRAEIPATVYLPRRQDKQPGENVTFVVRGQPGSSTESLITAVKATITAASPRASLGVRLFETQLSESLAMERLLANLSGFFGVLALVLAMIGLYGLMSYNVARRRNEIGIRIALGAAHSRVLGLVLGEVGRMTIAGVVLGIAAAIAASRLLKSFLFGLSATDPLTMVGSTLLLLLVAALAGYLPARRASRMDPMVALREE